MKILQRYILQELWLPFLICVVTLNFIFMGGYLVRAANFIIGRGVPLWDTLLIILLALPEMMSYTIPMSLLTAVLIVFGNLSQSNEIRAVKASGVHPLLIITPALLVGLVMSVFMFVFNDQVMTNADFALRKMTKQLIIRHPMAVIEPGRFVKLSDSVTFRAKELKGRQIFGVVAYENEGGDNSKPIRTILADRGEIVTQPGDAGMQIRLFDGSISDSQNASIQSIQFKSYEFPTLGQEDIRKMQKKIRDLTLSELLLRLGREGLSKEDRREVWSSFHQRIAFAFGSLIFVFMGIPVAILVHRGEIILSFGIAMIAAGVYYILFVGAKTLAIQGTVPPLLSFWIPNVLLAWAGAYLLKRSVAT